ncbi:hypothetical protein AB674_17430 [Flavobacterium sp. ABG]|nr:hypothetical protein AB674_17430 [Flavobacterium sp. ABG]
MVFFCFHRGGLVLYKEKCLTRISRISRIGTNYFVGCISFLRIVCPFDEGEITLAEHFFYGNFCVNLNARNAKFCSRVAKLGEVKVISFVIELKKASDCPEAFVCKRMFYDFINSNL